MESILTLGGYWEFISDVLVQGSRTGTDRTEQHFEEPKPTENRIFKIYKTWNRPKTKSQKEVQSIFSGGMK